VAYNPSVQATQVLRSSATAIGTSYDSSNIPECKIQNMNRVTLMCDLTLATATSVEIQVDLATPADSRAIPTEVAPVAADWYPLASANVSGLTITATELLVPQGQLTLRLTATGKYAIVLKDVFGKYLRVRAKTTAGPGATTLSIIGVEGLA